VNAAVALKVVCKFICVKVKISMGLAFNNVYPGLAQGLTMTEISGDHKIIVCSYAMLKLLAI
jgi:hypothetical protein